MQSYVSQCFYAPGEVNEIRGCRFSNIDTVMMEYTKVIYCHFILVFTLIIIFIIFVGFFFVCGVNKYYTYHYNKTSENFSYILRKQDGV